MQQIDTYTRKLLAPLLKHIASQPTLNNTKINLPLTYIPEPITTLAQILSTALAMQKASAAGDPSARLYSIRTQAGRRRISYSNRANPNHQHPSANSEISTSSTTLQ